MIGPALESVARRAKRTLAARPGAARRAPLLTVEKAAALLERGPRGPLHALEAAVSLVSMPGILTGVGTLDKLLDSMARHDIERTVLIAGAPVAPNRWVLDDAVRAAGDRIVPVTTLPSLPREGTSEAAWIDGFTDYADRGACGFKIHNNVEGLTGDHPAYRALFQVAQARGLFVILHTGCFHVFLYKNRQPSAPAEFEPLFRDFPDVRVCLAHMNREHPEQVWEQMQAHDQLYTDTSWQPASVVRKAVDAVGSERLLLGSDWPLLHDELQGEALDILRRAVSDRDFERIGQDNAERFLSPG